MGIARKIGKFLGYAVLGTAVLSTAAAVGAAEASCYDDVLAVQYDLHASELEMRAREARFRGDYFLAASYEREASYARQRARRVRFGVL